MRAPRSSQTRPAAEARWGHPQDDFELVKVLAKGSSGVVHLARRKRDGREYAIKQVALRDYEPSKREEVIAEARALTKLNSP